VKLSLSPTSPFVRKVLVAAHEIGIADRIESVDMSSAGATAGLDAVNPLGKVPAMILNDGTTLMDSPLLCEYLDSLHDGCKLFPASGAARWTSLRQQAIGDGVMDAAVARVGESRRPEGERSPGAVVKQTGKIARSLDLLEREAADLEGEPTIGTITVACALGYLDFRAPDEGWRSGRPKLAAWYERFAARPSMAATVPPA
jgi:glutathione S-transferase